VLNKEGETLQKRNNPKQN